MAHHSSVSSDLLQQIFGERPAEERPGPTGAFPQGKLTPEDEGEIRVGIADVDGKVVIDFGKPTAWIGFSPDQAEEIGRVLRERAAKARPATPYVPDPNNADSAAWRDSFGDRERVRRMLVAADDLLRGAYEIANARDASLPIGITVEMHRVRNPLLRLIDYATPPRREED